MTDRENKWTRRQFSQLFAAAAASSLLAGKISASAVASHDGFAFVGAPGTGPTDGAVRVYRTSGAAWRQVCAVNAASPAHLVMHPTLPMLYVVHDVAEWDHRPRGAVSAYRLDPSTGHLTHAVTQPLSLSASNPRHAIVVANGQALFVSAESGGIYNVLPLAVDGTLQAVSAIRKECGMQDRNRESTSTPRQLVLCADGTVSAVDPGQGTTSNFIASRDAITLQHRGPLNAAVEAEGASRLVLHVDG